MNKLLDSILGFYINNGLAFFCGLTFMYFTVMSACYSFQEALYSYGFFFVGTTLILQGLSMFFEYIVSTGERKK